MEEQKANGAEISDESIIGFKTGLMGPLSGIGDSICWGTFWTMFNAFAAGLAVTGNILTLLFVFAVPALLHPLGYIFTNIGYKQGVKSVKKLLSGGLLGDLVTCSNIVGLFMMGALSASIVKLSTAIQITASDKVFVIQDILDSIVPGILPLCAVFLVYYGYAKKKITPTVMVCIIVVISILGTIIGLF